MLVEMRRFIPEIIRSDDGGVAPGIAAAEPALLDHPNIGDAVLLGEVVGGGETMAAAADDDHVVFRLRLRAAPSLLPVLVIVQRVPHQGEDRIDLFHPVSPRARRTQLRFGAHPAKRSIAPPMTARHLMSRYRRRVNRWRSVRNKTRQSADCSPLG